MNKFYLQIFPVALLLLFTGCSKDIFKRYEKRIQGGTWELYKVKTSGLGSRYDPAFLDGRFTFNGSGQVVYQDASGILYHGDWDIRRRTNYNNNGDNDLNQSLYITVFSTLSQEVLSEYFDVIQFTATNRFCAYIYSGSRTYIFYFRR